MKISRLQCIFTTLILLTSLVLFTPVKAQYNRDYFYWLGRNSLMHDDYLGAIRTLNILLSVDANAYEGYFLRGIAKYNLDDLVGADADLTAAINRNPVFTSAYVNRAITRSRLGNYDDALKDFEEAIELRPDLPSPYYSRGVTRLLNKQYEEAIRDFNQFIKFENRVCDAYINRGISYLYLRDTLSALRDFDMAVETNPYSSHAFNRRGSLYVQMERYVEAERDFDKAIENDPEYLLGYFNRALVYNDTRRPMEALSDLDMVIKLDSNSSIGYFNRAIMRSQIGDYNRALEDYDRVVELSPENVLVYFYRANLLQQLGEVESAERNYTKSIELYPDFANAYLYRSDVRMLLNNSRGAMSDRKIAERKIAEHKSKLANSSYSIYTDESYDFDKLLSFETSMGRSRVETLAMSDGKNPTLNLLPLFRFIFTTSDESAPMAASRYYSPRLNSFISSFDNDYLTLSNSATSLSAQSLMELDDSYKEQARGAGSLEWGNLFELAISQGLIRQYTNSVNTLSSAIELNPTNPFLYFNRSTTRAEMIDFISSIDNTYQRITIDSDPASQLRNSSRRVYNYDDAIADLNKVVKLYPDFAYAYYNRANLHALSGELPEAYDDYTRAIELYPSFGEAYFNRGIVQILMKDTHKGAIDLSKAGELGIEQSYEMLEKYK
ncbi:MAG: tetratricopeptide repeat protein [Rikenellaceae bacterium]